MKLIKKTFAGIASLILLSQGLNAAVVSYNATHSAGSAEVSFALNQFNTSLGALTGVTITVNYSTLTGSFTVENGNNGTVSVNSYVSTLSIKGANSDPIENFDYTLGFTDLLKQKTAPVTTPAWKDYSLGAYSSQTFTIGVNPNFYTNSVQNIASSYFDAYKGSGAVVLKAFNSQAVTTTGSIVTLDTSAVGADTQMTIAYTYDAVPEPSTYALLIVAGGFGLVVVRRRGRAVAKA